jgi:hypothetical protein
MPGEQEQRYVLLPASEGAQVGNQASWQPTKSDIEGLEANLRHISDLQARGWKPAQHMYPSEQPHLFIGMSL